MGNANGKKESSNPNDQQLDDLFISLSRNSSSISVINLKKSWAPQLDPHLYNILEAYLYRESRNGLSKHNFKDLFLGVCKADVDERARNILALISNTGHVPRAELLQLIISVLKSVLIIQQTKSIKSFTSWTNRMSVQNDDSVAQYGNYFMKIIDKTNKSEFGVDDIRNLLVHFDIFVSMTLASVYQTEEYEYFAHLLPRWKYEPIESGRKLEEISVLDLVRIIFINSELPIDYQNEWRLLFSSAIGGESFSRLCGHITNKGPNVIIIKDNDGHIFGGFATDSWKMGPNFIGDSRSFLFTLYPEMNLYSSSGFNSNFQYANVGQQTMPNGLGMGGQLNYFGFWISADYGSGHCSESCTTYRHYRMMSSKKEFHISHLEVWGVGPPPPSPADLGERSCLDGNLEAKAILEMAGKSAYSEGLREKPKD